MSASAVTRNIRVSVDTEYSPAHSNPQMNKWFFLYTIRLTNEGKETVQLLSRHWIITDSKGKVEEVQGPGVIGQQPVLEPGESFEYTSGCPLDTPFGSMRGTYQMMTDKDEDFEIQIPHFVLTTEPFDTKTVH